MSVESEKIDLCEKISSSLERNGFQSVQCEHDGKDYRLTGSVTKEEDRAVAYALARTTIGIEKVINSITVGS